MKKPIYILGTGLSHDGSSCLMKDGKIVVAIEKERLTRKKHDGYNDNLTLQYCLDAEGITFNDISLVVEKNTINLAHDKEGEKLKKGRIIPEYVPKVTISHHLAHAYSAIGTSPFEEMGIVVLDGRGASLDNCIDVPKECLPNEIQKLHKAEHCHYFEKESYYVYEKGKLTPIFKDFSRYQVLNRDEFPFAPNDMKHSIAELYGGASQYVFGSDFTEGKLMGLAPFGRKGIHSGKLFDLKNSRAFINYETMRNIAPSRSVKKQSFWNDFQYYADIAWWVQDETEQAVKYLFDSYYSKAPQKNVAYAGGLALNAVCNGKLKKSTKFEEFYFQPAAGDNGLAIGCCYYGWLEVLGKEKVKHNKSTYFGKVYREDVIIESLAEVAEKVHWERRTDYIEETAKYLACGKVVGWFQGESEFGPRALGNRSILADPRQMRMQEYINREIKHREDFRPFAPSVLIEELNDCFELDYDTSYYMILVGKTKKEWVEKIPSVTHKDNSARVQTVSEKITPIYYSLIKEFKRITGIPMLLNTSFNDKAMPIVETPKEALEFFVYSKLDVLVMHDYLITRKNIKNEDKKLR